MRAALLGWWGTGRGTGRKGSWEGMMLELRVKGGAVVCSYVKERTAGRDPSLPYLLLAPRQVESPPFSILAWYPHF